MLVLISFLMVGNSSPFRPLLRRLAIRPAAQRRCGKDRELNWYGLDQWQQWVLAIGGSLAAALIAWFCKRLFWPKSEGREEAMELAQENKVQQNASPVVMTQNFQPTINIPIGFHPQPTVPPKDTLNTLQIESEFRAVRELWKRIVALKDAFWDIPKVGGFIGPQPGSSESAAFVRLYNDTARFLNEETLSIPNGIVAEANSLLKIASEEAIKALHYPDPFNGHVKTLLGEKGWRDFVESRSDSIRNFNIGVDKLQNTIRTFLEGRQGKASLNNKSPQALAPKELSLSYISVTGLGWFLLEVGVQWYFQIIQIRNSQVDIPTEANNVRARLEYYHADGERFFVDEALWLAVANATEFTTRLQIASGKTAYLCLIAQQAQINGPYTVITDVARRSRNKALKAGRWSVRISIASDNFRPLVGAGGFILSEDHRLAYIQPKAFTFETGYETQPLD